jgi:hypothetical protein
MRHPLAPELRRPLRRLHGHHRSRYQLLSILIGLLATGGIIRIATHFADDLAADTTERNAFIIIFFLCVGGAAGSQLGTTLHNKRREHDHEVLATYLNTHLTADGTAHPDAVNDLATIISRVKRSTFTHHSRLQLITAITHPTPVLYSIDTGEPNISYGDTVTLLRYRNLGRVHPAALLYQHRLLSGTADTSYGRSKMLTDVAAAINTLPTDIADIANTLAGDIDAINGPLHKVQHDQQISNLYNTNIWDDLIGTATALRA